MTLTRFRQRIDEVGRSPDTGPVLIVALGDSITMGCTSLGTLEPEAVYHARLKRMLEDRHPNAVFSVINAGVGGQRAGDGLARLQRQVIAPRPDLVIIAFGANDAHAGEAGLDVYRDALASIVRQSRERTDADVVLMTPPFQCTEASPRVAAAHRDMVEAMMHVQRSGLLARYADVVRQLGTEHDVPVADVHARWQQLADAGLDTTAMLANGLNHPTGAAHRYSAELLMALMEDAGVAVPPDASDDY